MPAITPSNLLSLPRIREILDATGERQPVSITTAPRGFEGEGFPVRRAFAGVDLSLLDPFIHLDEMGEVEYAPGEPKGTPWHPHRGFETATYMIDGTFEHQDSNGGGGLITNGDTQWMTAGGGLLHIEKPPEALVVSGGLFHGFQLWVNLPASMKWTPPRYQGIEASKVRLVSSSAGDSLLRIIAGSLDGYEGPGNTHTPMTMIHATLSPGARLVLPWEESYNALAYVLSGDALVGGTSIHGGQLVVFGPGKSLAIQAKEKQETRLSGVDILLLGGKPIREPIAWAGPFVMNSKEEILKAFEDYRQGRLGTIPAIRL